MLSSELEKGELYQIERNRSGGIIYTEKDKIKQLKKHKETCAKNRRNRKKK